MSNCKLHNNPEGCKKCKANERARKYRRGKGKETRRQYEKRWMSGSSGKESRRKSLRKYRSKKYKNDINYRLLHIQRQRISEIIKSSSRSEATLDLLGCSINKLKDHLEKQFDQQMCWSNYGTYWQVDHKFPLSKAILEGEDKFKESCHYTNLQPLTVEDNLRKSDKIM